MPKSVAIYGGSFDPPHVSHVLAAVYALKVGGFDQVLVVPVFEHAFQKRLSPFSHRVRMCELAFAGIQNVEVTAIEQTLPAPSLTLHTLERVSAVHPDWALRLLVGSDVLADTPKWHAFERICELAPLYVVARPGHPHPAAPVALLPDVSSTRIRDALADRDALCNAELLSASLPSAVLDYVAENGLYLD
jgi:nicotinate-nucleotide adenylyltransferase